MSLTYTNVQKVCAFVCEQYVEVYVVCILKYIGNVYVSYKEKLWFMVNLYISILNNTVAYYISSNFET